MILVLGSTGFLGRHVCERLEREGRTFRKTSMSLGVDLTDRNATEALFADVRPEIVINCAAFVGGIGYGFKYPADLVRLNLLMTLNLLEAARCHRVKRLINPIANCVYPAQAKVLREDELWNGPLHETVLAYGMMRKMCWVGGWGYNKQHGLDILSLILPNMYGPGDHFDEERSHAFGALVMKIVKAKELGEPYVLVWGTGTPVREWLHVADGAAALVRGIEAPATIDPVNIGIGSGISVIEMAEKIAHCVGYRGELRLDPSKPDGAPHKTVDGNRGEKLLGWRPEILFEDGVKETIAWYTGHKTNLR